MSDQPARFYQRLASLDFQKDQAGEWVYFPWDALGKGYRVKGEQMKEELEKFVARFNCVHSPLTAILLMVLYICWHYLSQTQVGVALLGLYFPMAYLWLGWGVRNKTASLEKHIGKFNKREYASHFLKVFHWKVLLEPEVVVLFVFMAGLWLILSNKWVWYFAPEDVYIVWTWVILSGCAFIFFSFWNYFRQR